MTVLFLAAGLTVMVSCVCSLFESILYSTRVGALEAEKAEGTHSRLAECFMAMKSNIAEPTSAILVLNTIANTAGATLCGMYATQVLGSSMVPVVSAILTVAILFIGEILPKTYGATHWRTIWHFIVWPLAVMQKGLAPIIRVTQGFANFFTGSYSTPPITEDEIQASIRLGRKAGELSRNEIQLLDAVFHFDEMSVRQVMVPRGDVVFLDASWPFKKCLKVAMETRHTRFPLCLGSLDEPRGLIHIKDLLGVSDQADFELESIARTLQHVPETLPISRLLREMQRTHRHMALVDDEYGTVAGMVTMENLVEQIVGAVQDEFDSETPDILAEGPWTYSVKGQLSLARVNRECGLNLYSAEVETLSGLLVSRLGRLLKQGDRVPLRGAMAEVVEERNGRADVIRIHISQNQEAEK